MAGLPKELIESPKHVEVGRLATDDALSDVLRNIRLSGSLQFCFMPTGAWQTDAAPSLSELSGKPAVLDLPTGKGRIVAFEFDPIHRYQTVSDFRLVWNLILNWNDLPPAPKVE